MRENARALNREADKMARQVTTTDPDQTSNPTANAMEWAKNYFKFASQHRVANHTWAKTYRLSGYGESEAYLKVLPKMGKGPNHAISHVSKFYQPHVPKLIKASPKLGLYLFGSHGGTEYSGRLDGETKLEVLAQYGRIQNEARSRSEEMQNLPHVTCEGQFDRLMNLMAMTLSGKDDPQIDGNPFAYMRKSTVTKYHNIFVAAEPVLRVFLKRGDTLDSTLNHCDLRSKNIARRPDGTICIFDWDDAVYGPPGFSLHALFSGCSRINAALSENSDGSREDQKTLARYIKSLTREGAYSKSKLIEGLPATACAGVMCYIANFAEYPVRNESSRKSILRNVRRRLSDLIDIACSLSARSPATANKMADVLEQNGRSSRAKSLRVARSVAPTKDAIPMLIKKSDPLEVFPSVEISDEERQAGKLADTQRKLAVEMFRRHGGMMIKNAFPKNEISKCLEEFETLRREHQQTIKDGAARRVGDQRFMVSLELAGAYANPNVIASPFVLPILHRLLTKDAILGSLTAVASMPGAKDQSLHRDNPPLFEEASAMDLPSFCVALIIPLIPLNEMTGATRIIKGSHKLRTRDIEGLPFQNPIVEPGSCYLMDSRLFHQGMANKSDQIRPILSLVFQRPWYRDHKNFKKQNPLIMSEERLARFPTEMRKLVEWTRDPS